MHDVGSVTGPYLVRRAAGRRSLSEAVSGQASDTAPCAESAAAVRTSGTDSFLRLRSADLHNLRGIDVSFMKGAINCVCGLSGSGKTSLVLGTLLPRLTAALKTGDAEGLEGWRDIDRVIHVDQRPIGRSPRSVPATYIGFFDEIRRLFASPGSACGRSYKAGRFSFNDKAGRCPSCEGQGRNLLKMSFLPDTWVTCPECGGKRYNPDTLSVLYRGKSIADVLEMSAAEALEFFRGMEKIETSLRALNDVGLGYLKIGQSSATLSGGEAQRIKLAAELYGRRGRSLYIFDEPTTGLHFADVERLIAIFKSLAVEGNSLIIIEHNTDVMLQSDWLLELGPGGGRAGGMLVAEGPLRAVVESGESITGGYLRDLL